MFRRKRVVQDVVVADSMRRFFDRLKASDRAVPEFVAHRYGQHLFGRPGDLLSDELSRSRYYVGLSTGDSTHSFADLTRRATLVADTLLLAHDRTARYHEIGVQTRHTTLDLEDSHIPFLGAAPSAELAMGIAAGQSLSRPDLERRNSVNTAFGMHCPDLRALGTWILDAEPLLRAGLTWYLPSYSLNKYTTVEGVRHDSREPAVETKKALDYLIRDGRAVDASGADPIKSKLVRPVLHTELPFLQGVSLRDFSKITVDEFGSFAAFRDFLRLTLLGLDDALNDVQSEREMLKIGLKINEEVRAMRAAMVVAQRKRALSASGAVLGAAGTVLLAVYGPALATAIAALGASGGVWGFVSAMSEGSTTVLRENKWYYVWALANSSTRDG
uniref:hypothetical protein n=1 Tax=Paractinoplanes polyasparticus TaxID=2856853 RepID=UPI001C84C7DB|nr:hypothetical protein [Actinoplanes polyasparticus]